MGRRKSAGLVRGASQAVDSEEFTYTSYYPYEIFSSSSGWQSSLLLTRLVVGPYSFLFTRLVAGQCSFLFTRLVAGQCTSEGKKVDIVNLEPI